MNAIVATLVALLAAILIGAFLLIFGFKLRLKSFKTPFGEFDAARFADLSHVRSFNALSVIAVSPSPKALEFATLNPSALSPVLFVHAGWTTVCDTFVQQFKAYPDDEALRSAIGALGTQNAEFIASFRKIHDSAVRFADQVPRDFAIAYYSRAPALAQRITGSRDISTSDLYASLALAAAIPAPKP